MSNAEIAAALFVAEATVETQVAAVPWKLDLRNRAQLVVFAYEAGVVRAAAAS
jgi:DNA-binding NarL/FixJ family response regulator